MTDLMTTERTVSEPEVANLPSSLPWWANPRVGLVAVIAALVVLFSSLRPSFLNVDLTLVPMQADLSVFAVVGLAQLAVLSLGHMNLAVPRMAAISAFAAGLTYDRLHAPLLVGLLAALVVGALAGAVAGLIITSTGVNSFVVTLALDFGLLGLVSLLYGWFTNGVAFNVRPADPAGRPVRAGGHRGGGGPVPAQPGGPRDPDDRLVAAGRPPLGHPGQPPHHPGSRAVRPALWAGRLAAGDEQRCLLGHPR
jgi:hypothetical protein